MFLDLTRSYYILLRGISRYFSSDAGVSQNGQVPHSTQVVLTIICNIIQMPCWLTPILSHFETTSMDGWKHRNDDELRI